uniref:unspecific monooxygenase n=1 Tax=Mythimna separata TaxID=271217 RepID=A0A7G3WA73_MYTSE|nr:cytochrome P450 CYP6A104 [Mythimna separata]
MFLYLTVTLLVLLYYVITRKNHYWKDKNVPYKPPTFLLGNYGDVYLQKKSLGETLQDYCNEFPNEKFIGAFQGTEPVLIPKDPEIIKLIVTKDFASFNGRFLSEHSHKEPAALNLFATYGDSWRVLRQNMSPLFSSAKMKNMFHLIDKCAHRFEEMLDRETKISKALEARSMTAKYTMECIGACAFGVDTNTMTEDAKDNPFSKVAEFADPPQLVSILREIRSIWPSIFYIFGGQLIKKQFQFFDNLITSVMTRREYKHSGRNDFVDLVMSWKINKQIVGESLQTSKSGEIRKVSLEATDDLLVAQCFVFFAAGFETSSTTLGFTLYEIAKSEEIQKRVLEEVDSYLARHDNKLNFDCISDLPYLDAVIDEALRFYPVLGMIPRELMEDYTMPGGAKLDKGMRVHLPVYYLHHNPEFYPEPEVFRPERFLGEEKKKINPYVYLPFGEGPRLCIGMRFAKMQMMTGLITILKKYRLELADGMPRKLQFKPVSGITHSKDGIMLKFIEREGWENRVFVK